MQRHKRRGMGDRSFQAGKGSKERGSEWRKFYSDINWPSGGNRTKLEGDGFKRIGRKLFKRYGTAETIKDDTAPAVVIH